MLEPMNAKPAPELIHEKPFLDFEGPLIQKLMSTRRGQALPPIELYRDVIQHRMNARVAELCGRPNGKPRESFKNDVQAHTA